MALTGSWAGCRQRRDQDGSAPKALRLVIAALAGLLGGREERVQVAARPVQPKTVALQGETNGQTARSPTIMPEDPDLSSFGPTRCAAAISLVLLRSGNMRQKTWPGVVTAVWRRSDRCSGMTTRTAARVLVTR